MEKRRSRRHGRRLKVRFGEKGQGFTHSGITNDVSATGLFVLANQTPKPGTRLHVEVTLPGELLVFAEGVVARQVIVPPQLRQVVKAGFGLRYLTGAELMAELVPALSTVRPDDPFLLRYEDETQLHEAFEKELRRGGVFVWSARAVTLNSIVTVTFDLVFLEKRLAFEARVVHAMPGAEGKHGVGLMFVDPGAVTGALAALLGH